MIMKVEKVTEVVVKTHSAQANCFDSSEFIVVLIFINHLNVLAELGR